jgi:UDP-N-acetylmuramoyl-tripeptide--D-alanyl-D-alanine ligase
MACCPDLNQLISVLGATPRSLNFDPAVATGVTTDTRNLEPGSLFLALRGETFDGHQFVPQAIAQGAIAAVVERGQAFPNLPVLEVEDTLRAYQDIAQWWRQQFTIPIVAITGSVGKTTTKEFIAAVLGTQGPVLKTQANYNNEIGVPKTLLELDRHHRYAVIEMGMRGQGEIALLSQIAQPDVSIITNVGTAHIGRLGSEQAIADAKCELLAEMPAAGKAVLNYDNARLINTAAGVWSGNTVTYGLTGGDVHGTLIDPETLQVGQYQFPLPLPGAHNALNYLAALAVAQVLGVDWAPLRQGLKVDLPSGRARRHTLPNDIVLLDETYNAGLESMLAALELLAQTPGQRRIAVLGTMKELGDRSVEFHRQVGEKVQALQLDELLILADPAEAVALAEGATATRSRQFSSHTELTDYLQSTLQAGDRILFKASRAVALDRVVQAVIQTMQSPAE